ncbi:hypothetical protein HNP29_006123 [Pseudomonas alcaligenes]|nr:hypothetical protein [Pseudomonas alcaligenes]
MKPFSRAVYAVAGLCLLASQAGCAQLMNQDLSPPPGGETVSVSVKVPKDLAADSMKVMYRSVKCPITRSDGNGGRYEIDGAKEIEVEPQRQGITDIYEAKLPRDGGGACQWKLSNVTFGVRFWNTEPFGENIEPISGGGIIVVFDGNPPQRISMYGAAEVSGNLRVRKHYYPWVSESFLGGYRKLVRPFTQGDLFLTYVALRAKEVFFEPAVHNEIVVYSVGPKIKKKGNYTQFTYPDGSSVADGSSRPNFKILEEIRLGRRR